MNYRIESKESFEVFGIEWVFHIDGSGDMPKSPAQLWEQCHANGEVKRLEDNAGQLPSFVSEELYKAHGICSYRNTGEGTFPYMICAFKGDSSITSGYQSVVVPANTWAIFRSELFTWDHFDNIIDTLYRRFYTEWLPTSGYELIGGAEMEIYGKKSDLNFVELWFAVRKI